MKHPRDFLALFVSDNFAGHRKSKRAGSLTGLAVICGLLALAAGVPRNAFGQAQSCLLYTSRCV